MYEPLPGVATAIAAPGSNKHRNESLMEPPEILEVDSPTIACDGGGGALGHPRVFLNMGEKTKIDCPYCGRQYVLKAGAAAPAGH